MMKRRKIYALVIGAGVLVALGGAAVSGGAAGGQPEGQAPDLSKMSTDELIKMMDKMSAPVEEHRVLDAFVGVFDLRGTFSMGPGMTLEWESTSTGKKILGGRFLETDSISKPDEKIKVEAKSILGYDARPGRGKYTLWGIDTMGTYSVSAEGDYDPETRVLELIGTMSEGGREGRFRQLFDISNPDEHKVKVQFEQGPGEWVSVVEMLATRRK